jgi:hypothetical protein
LAQKLDNVEERMGKRKFLTKSKIFLDSRISKVCLNFFIKIIIPFKNVSSSFKIIGLWFVNEIITFYPFLDLLFFVNLLFRLEKKKMVPKTNRKLQAPKIIKI